MKRGILALVLLMAWQGIALADDDRHIAIMTIALEARGESLEGQVAVGEVIRNRAFKARRTFGEVCLAPWQFSAWNDGYTLKKAYSRVSEQAYQRASEAWERSEGINRGFTHYHNGSVSPKWSRGKQAVKIGNHYFYKGVA